MPARSEWKGFLEVNQLKVAVKAFSAASSEPEICLNQLHRTCGERIRQQRVCPIHGPIESEDIVSGYRIAEDCYLPIEQEELEQLKPDSDKAIAVHCFVDRETIDPVFHSGRTLYLVPDGPPGQRPFCVLREGMKSTGRHAFSRLVISRREQLALLRPYGRLLAMTFVEYPHRIRASTDYESEISNLTPGANELGLVRQLINTMTDSQFQLHRYRDQYMDRLSNLIERRVAATDLTSQSPQLERQGDDDALLAILKASLTAAGITDHPIGSSLGEPTVVADVLQEQKSA